MIDVNALVQEKFLFLHKFLRSPKQMGSITPSSKFLARAMVRHIPWHEVSAAAELGAGTGAITEQIQVNLKERTKLLLFEKDGILRDQLAVKYPGAACYADACHIRNAMKSEGIGQLDAIVSGLPFFNFPQGLRDNIMKEVAASLKPGGYFIAFQYSLQMKHKLSGDFDMETIDFVPFNLPPAFVYVCRKRG
ncbi:phospholipid methyltransferase [Paenibacillus doosanensis]|uniref:class I SAM-dependent methyltransferase n=1 Tax=Paenibacillus doosanensis TaxID=1229154 RepID=UPI00217F2F21|nr:phospholipid methyltransferase [Paenibacillus doosanensis]MCS7458980.1 phospholipid methyltransferase [Paenibacillus doosanensis]